MYRYLLIFVFTFIALPRRSAKKAHFLCKTRHPPPSSALRNPQGWKAHRPYFIACPIFWPKVSRLNWIRFSPKKLRLKLMAVFGGVLAKLVDSKGKKISHAELTVIFAKFLQKFPLFALFWAEVSPSKPSFTNAFCGQWPSLQQGRICCQHCISKGQLNICNAHDPSRQPTICPKLFLLPHHQLLSRPSGEICDKIPNCVSRIQEQQKGYGQVNNMLQVTEGRDYMAIRLKTPHN